MPISNNKKTTNEWTKTGLGTGIFKCRKWWIEPGFIAS